MSVEDVAEAVELMTRGIVAAAQGKSMAPLDRHLERILEVRIEQRVPVADIATAFSLVRKALADLAESETAQLSADRETLVRTVDATETRALQRLHHRG